MPLAAKASVFSAHVVPAEGGQTEWADMRAAYDELPEKTKAQIADLSAYHSLYYSQAKLGHQAKLGASYGFHNEEPPLRPLIKVHPVTDRKALYIGRHASHIVGRRIEEGRALLAELLAAATGPELIYRHRWRQHDMVMWDNRMVLHRGHPWDASKYARVMHRTTIAGRAQDNPWVAQSQVA